MRFYKIGELRNRLLAALADFQHYPLFPPLIVNCQIITLSKIVGVIRKKENRYSVVKEQDVTGLTTR